MTNEEMMNSMLGHQQELNSIINPNWMHAGYNWHRAIWVECAELMDTLDWKWWKAAPPINLKQQQLEVADIWHFVLSLCIEQHSVPVFDLTNLQTRNPLVREIEWLAHSCLDYSSAQLIQLRALIVANKLGMQIVDLYRLHTTKWLLNQFRQLNGYADGTYRKVWYDGREDNHHLAEICEAYDITNTLYHANIMYALGARYEKVQL